MPIANQIIRQKFSGFISKSAKVDALNDGFITLPSPPSMNHLYPTNRYGRRYLSSEGKAYHRTIAAIAVHSGVRLIKGPVKVTTRFYRRQKRGDLDNSFKCIADGLKGIAWDDDEQITEIHMYRYDDPKNPRLELKIEPA